MGFYLRGFAAALAPRLWRRRVRRLRPLGAFAERVHVRHAPQLRAAQPALGEQLRNPSSELVVWPARRGVGVVEPVAQAGGVGLPSSLYAAARLYAGEQLQRLLVATIDLGLIVNQAHWNVHGRGSHALQLLFDDLSEALARQRELLARRAAELGVAPDGRAYTVATESRLAQLADGPIAPDDAAAAVADRLGSVADLARQQLGEFGASDPVTRHVLTELSQLAEHHHLALERTGIHA